MIREVVKEVKSWGVRGGGGDKPQVLKKRHVKMSQL